MNEASPAPAAAAAAGAAAGGATGEWPAGEQQASLPDDEATDEDLLEGEEEDEFVYSPLDTIAEVEEEEDEDCDSHQTNPLSSRQPPGGGNHNNRQQRRLVNKQATTTTTTVRPQAASAALVAPQPQPQQPQQTATNEATNQKCDTEATTKKRTMQPPQPLGAQLPSTNRLISEHQARQQQRLFRALAERQKMLDELDDGHCSRRLDLMSAASLDSSLLPPHPTSQRSRSASDSRRRRRRRKRREDEDEVPLSAVDLASMSDGMLDDLLGRLASASSSSLSSTCGESLPRDSSDFSCSSSSGDDDDDDAARRRATTKTATKTNANEKQHFGSPSVVGVHEEPAASDSNQLRRLAAAESQACREAHRRSQTKGDGRDQDDDDHDQRQRQQLDVSELAPTGGSLSPGARPPPTKLEHYFTSGLVRPHRCSQSEASEEEDESEDSQQVESVEQVLSRMLAALEAEEEGSHEEGRLNGLLERGFAHLEQLLQCSLAPTTTNNTIKPNQTKSQQLTSSQQLLMSKDSDYGSDTQSGGDAQQAHHHHHQSPSPSSLQTSASSSSSTSNQHQPPVTNATSLATGANKRTELSPLAIELSFKLAESLHRLAQQQAAKRRPADDGETAVSNNQTTPTVMPANQTKARGNLRSVVLINSSPSTGASTPSPSLQHPASPTSPVSMDALGGTKSPKPFKTRVNIGSSPSSAATAATQVVVVAASQQQKPAEPQAEVTQQQQVAFERRRSLRSSSMRRRILAANGQQPPQPRPGSPLPRSSLQQEQQVQQQHQQQQEEPTPGQLQRALVLAQKHNYSPAKLAASKLQARLARPASSPSGGMEQQPQVGQQQQQRRLSQPEQQQQAGRMELDISYFPKSGSLAVHVIRCQQLAAVSKRRTTSNPYVKLYLLPDRSKSGKRRSSVRRQQLEPQFDETFTFGPLQPHQFAAKTLWLSVWHKDRLGRGDFLGELLLPLADLQRHLRHSDLCQTTGARWYPLSDLPRPPAPKEGVSLDASQQQLQRNKLDELQLKAARLATAAASVAPAGGEPTSPPPPPEGMRVRLGPPPLVAAASAGTEIDTNHLPPSIANQVTGQLFVALKFVSSTPVKSSASSRSLAQLEGELHVLIKEAHNIGGYVQPAAPAHRPPPPAGALPNPFCKCYLLGSDGRRLSKQKTPHLKRTINPRWDHRCAFTQLRLGALTSQAIEIHMFNRDSILVSHEHLGGVRLCRPQSADQQQQPQQQEDATSIASSERSSSQDGSSLRRSLGGGGRQDSSCQHEEKEGALCNEREARLWSQMLARPNIWVYGELTLRHLRPLVPAQPSATSMSNGGQQQQQ